MIRLLCVALICGLSILASQSVEPSLLSGRIPMPTPPLFAIGGGELVVRIVVSDGRVGSYKVLDVRPDGLDSVLRTAAVDVIKGWRFEHGWSGTLQVRVRYQHSTTGDPCAWVSPSVTMVGVTDITIDGTIEPRRCGSVVEDDAVAIEVSTLSGRVLCDCPEGGALRGATLYISDVSLRGRQRISRIIRSDADGRFVASELPQGRYSVSVQADGYTGRHYTVVITPDPSKAEMSLSLKRDTARGPAHADARVLQADVPIYPSDAKVRRIEGEVKLRLSLSENMIIDVDAEASEDTLRRAAEANARSWILDAARVPVLHVLYRYELDDGDCGTRPTSVTARFPHEVTIRACSGR